jgi:uncharacterized repeat protein (TIGR02543 family)/uncharacterized repeat protein (TIGR01451 family)
MKGKLKKYIAFLMIFTLILNISFIAYADAVSNINKEAMQEGQQQKSSVTNVVGGEYLTYSADSRVQTVTGVSPNKKTQARLFWVYDDELYIAIIGSLKVVEKVSYNNKEYDLSVPGTGIEIEIAANSDDVLKVDGNSYIVPAELKDHAAHWVVINLGSQVLTIPFTLGIKTTAGGFDAWGTNKLIVDIDSSLQVYHQYGDMNPVLDINQSGELTGNSYNVSPIYEYDSTEYDLTSIKRVINGHTDYLSPSDLVDNYLSGAVPVQADGTSAEITFIYEEASNEVSYTVTFDENYTGAVDPYDVAVAEGATLGDNMPGDPSRLGYTFAGWYPNADGTGTRFEADTEVSGDITVYAKWTQNQVNCTVTFDENYTGAVDPYDRTVAGNATLGDSMPSNPSRAGYTFEGWYENTDGTGSEFAADTVVTKTMTVFAKWAIKYFALIINYELAEGGLAAPIYKNETMKMGDAYDVASPRRSGYTADKPAVSGIMPDADVTIEVIYTTNTPDPNPNPTTNYIVEYELADGFKLKSDKQVLNQEIEARVTENAESFIGYTSDEATKSLILAASGNVITFVYTPYTVTYSVNYLEKLTNKVLAEAKKGTGKFNTEVIESAIDIADYNKIEPTSITRTLSVEGNEINFYYVKKVNPPADDNDDDDEDDNDDNDEPILGKPDLKVTKTDNGVMVSPGALVEYIIGVENQGNAPAEGVKVYETLPVGTEFIASNNQGWALEDGKYVYDLGLMNVGDKKKVKFVLKVNNPLPTDIDEILNDVEVKDDGTETAIADNKASEDTPILIATQSIEEPPVIVPSTPPAAPTQEIPIEEPAPQAIPDLPFTGGMVAIELLAMGLGLSIAAVGIKMRRK